MGDIYGMRVGQVVHLPLTGRAAIFHRRRACGVTMRVSLVPWRCARRTIKRRPGITRVTDAGLWLTPGVAASPVIADLRAQIESPAVEFAETDEIRELSLRIFDRSFAVTYVLEIAAIVYSPGRNRGDLRLAGDRPHARVRHAAPYRRDAAAGTSDARIRRRVADSARYSSRAW